MKICVVAYKFGTEKEIGEHLGTYHYFIEKMRRLAKMGHEVLVVAPWIGFWRRGRMNIDGVKVLRYYPPFFNRPKLLVLNQIWRAWYIRATQRQVLKADKQTKLDVIYVWQARETGYAIAKIKARLRAPFVFRQITAWQWHFERMRLDRRPQEKFAHEIYERADKVVFVSRAASQEGIASGLLPEKVEIIGVGIETDIFRPAGSKPAGGDKTILFIGRINFAEKGIGYLLEVMPEITRAVPGARLVIIGAGGEWERLQKKIEDLGIKNYVQCIGKKPFQELPEHLNAADVLAVPSVWVEHFGQVTVEAMACGIPVVTSDTGGSPEINIDGETGFVVSAKDSGALARAIIKILQDENLRKKFGEAARQRVLENYTYEVLTQKFLDVVRKVQT